MNYKNHFQNENQFQTKLKLLKLINLKMLTLKFVSILLFRIVKDKIKNVNPELRLKNRQLKLFLALKKKPICFKNPSLKLFYSRVNPNPQANII